MHRYQVPKMSCGHCVGTIEKAIKALDENAEISIDLAVSEVRVQSGTDERAIGEAIRAAGYENTPVAA